MCDGTDGEKGLGLLRQTKLGGHYFIEIVFIVDSCWAYSCPGLYWSTGGGGEEETRQ